MKFAYTYNLPDVKTVNGTFHIEVHSDTSTDEPQEGQTIISLGQLEILGDVSVDETEVPRLTMEVLDDYLGFWAAMVGYRNEIIITLTELDNVERFVFAGKIEIETVEFRVNTYDVASTGVRTGTIAFTLNGLIGDFFELLVDDWVTEVLANDIHLDTPVANDRVWHVMSVRGLFAAMLSASLLNNDGGDPEAADYDLADVEFIADANCILLDFKDTDVEPITHWTIEHLYVPTQYKDGGGGLAPVGNFDSSNDLYFGKRYGSMREMLKAICDTFALRVELYYDMDDSRYKLRLLQKWYAYAEADPIDVAGKLKQETIGVGATQVGDAVRATAYRDSQYYVWQSYDYTGMEFYLVAPQSSVQFDKDVTCLWDVLNYDHDGNAARLYASTAELTGGEHPINDLYVPIHLAYRKSSTVTVEATDPGSDYSKLEQALCGIYSYRIVRKGTSTAGWNRFQHTYWGITCTYGGIDSISNWTLMKIQNLEFHYTIGFTSPYYANKITIDLDNSETEVEWIQEEI